MKKLTLKTFVFLLGLLLVISTVSYLCIWLFLSEAGKTRSQRILTEEIKKLTDALYETKKTESGPLFSDFIRKTGAYVFLLDIEGNTVNPFTFCDTDEYMEGGGKYPFRFFDTLEEYILIVNYNDFYSVEIKTAIFNSIPFVAAVMLILSAAGAMIFSRHTVEPIIRISKIADKMANIDFSWYCPDLRDDEIGILSGSINKMSDRLHSALDELNMKNSALSDEIALEKERERRRMLFFSGVSHELKTPIAVVIGQLEGMQAGIGVYKDREKYMERSAKILRSLSSFIKEVLEVSYLDISDSTQCSRVCLSEEIRLLAEEYSGYAGDDSIDVFTDIQEGIVVEGDEKLFLKALGNIIGNAFTHTSDKGSVRISLTRGDGVRLTVENSPAHIGEEHLPHLFEAFYRADSSSEYGSGLGLYITQMIFEKYGIDHNIENTANGVKFTVIFSSYT